MRSPRLSVVTPTYNRRDRLARVLEALRAQSVSPEIFEVVVVDDGSSDDTVAWLEAQHFPFTLQIRSQANQGPAVARNTGVTNASGDLVLFLDDDVVPVPELIEQHLASHDAESADLVVLGTLSSLPHYEQPWVAWEQVQVEKQYTAMQRGDYAPTFRQFWTGNASVSRQHLLDAGLFNSSFLRGEDVELGRRLAERGLEFRFNPRAKGLHHAERSLASFRHAHESYGRLEVEIFEGDSQEALLEVLGGNLARLHSTQRAVVLRAIRAPLAYRGLERTLCQFLESKLAKRSDRVALRVCSLLANLLYWRASAEALGPDRFDEVLRLARRGGGQA